MLWNTDADATYRFCRYNTSSSFAMGLGNIEWREEDSEDEEEALGHTCELCMEVGEKDEVENGGEWVFNKEDGVWNCGNCCNTNVIQPRKRMDGKMGVQNNEGVKCTDSPILEHPKESG